MKALHLPSLVFCLVVGAGCTASFSEGDARKRPAQLLSEEGEITYENFALAVIKSECLSCHGATPSGGAPSTIDLSSYEDVSADVRGVKSLLGRIAARVGADTMPPGGWEDETKRQRFLRWANEALVQESGEEDPVTTDPTIAFVKPLNLNETATGDSFAIEVAITNASADATYDLYYTSTADQTSGGQAIALGIAAATTSYTWDTTAVPDAGYYVYAILHSDSSTVTKASAGSIRVSSPASVNANPTIALSGTFRNGAGAIVQNAATNLTYSAADTDGDTLTYVFESSANAGTTWTPFTCASVTATGCQWNTSALAEGVQYRVRVTVQDGKGGAATAQSSANFGIGAMTYSYANFTQGLMTANCDSCHAGGFQGFQSDTEAGVKSMVDRIIVRAVQDQTMPQGTPLGVSDRVKLQLWKWFGTL